MAGRVQGKVAIVTGAGSVGEGVGNGKTAAILYAREGASVLLVDRDLDAAESTRSLIAEAGCVSFAHRADVSRAEECRGLVDRCLEAFGLLAVSSGLMEGELAMDEVDDGDEVAGGAVAAGAGLGSLDEGG